MSIVKVRKMTPQLKVFKGTNLMYYHFSPLFEPDKEPGNWTRLYRLIGKGDDIHVDLDKNLVIHKDSTIPLEFVKPVELAVGKIKVTQQDIDETLAESKHKLGQNNNAILRAAQRSTPTCNVACYGTLYMNKIQFDKDKKFVQTKVATDFPTPYDLDKESVMFLESFHGRKEAQVPQKPFTISLLSNSIYHVKETFRDRTAGDMIPYWGIAFSDIPSVPEKPYLTR